jgi:succinate-semialdehyde dehydrogenase/glutarate-semialdehyde dehydrogenase
MHEVSEKANCSQGRLGASIWSQNTALAIRAIRLFEVGVTWVNQIHYGYDELPFGGVKASGIGHEHGPEAVEYYLENKGAVFGGLDWQGD